jgi:hypothetical protein
MTVLFFMFSAIVALEASDKADYKTGKLTDLIRRETGAGAGRAQGSFCLAVQLNDLTYLVRHEATWRWSYEPTDLVVGDPVEVRIKGNDMYFKKPKGGELKTTIVRRERNAPGKEALKCGTPTTSD